MVAKRWVKSNVPINYSTNEKSEQYIEEVRLD